MALRASSMGRRSAPGRPPREDRPKQPTEPTKNPGQRRRLWTACALMMGATALRCADPEAVEELLNSTEWHSSPIDWCESNYEQHDGVAEFWNTFSNLATFPIIYFAWYTHRSFVSQVDASFHVTMLSLFCVGAGSMYFHWTLSTLGQVLDEMCICWTNYYAILLVMPRKRLEGWIGKEGRAGIFSTEGMLTVVLTTPVWALFYPIISHVLTVATIVLLPAAIIVQYRAGAARVCADGWRVLKQALVFHTFAVSCWVLDKLLCHRIPEFVGFNPQLHAWWHVFVFVGAYLTIVGVCYIRSVGDGHQPQVRTAACAVPYTSLE
eukprot:TRINITY_DN40848_c0_g1_i1.p1 TRINITY_DN40848_c0_g1~~TRINITY_DN40848_c0_g1_i1.p1  ORF type:complete len:322 (+),score=68.21 TRINITY_DN40848_c0_g1_i1:61-1026(+)